MNKRINLHYALIQALFWAAYCTGTGYMASCLLSIGYNNTGVGIAIALSGAGAVLAQSVLSGVIDRSGKKLLKPVILVCVITAIVLSLVELLFPADKIIIGICYGVNVASLQFLVPLINSMSICGRGEINFGLGRAAGSFVFAFAAVFVGKMVTIHGMGALSVIRSIAFTAFVICALTFPLDYSEPITGTKQKEDGFFRRNPGFAAIMAGCILVYFCQTLLNNNGYQVIVSKGGDNVSHGTALAIAALIEVPVMLVFQKLLKIKGPAFWFALSGFGYAVKAFAFLAAPSVIIYYVAQIAQLVGWPLMQVASVAYVRTITTDKDTTRGQAYITLTYSIALIAGSPLGGLLLQYLGVPVMLITAGICSIAGGAIMLAGIIKRNRLAV